MSDQDELNYEAMLDESMDKQLADMKMGKDKMLCICGDINARHCPVHSEQPTLSSNKETE